MRWAASLDYYDDGPLQEIVARLEADNYRFATLIVAIVDSYPFQYRRSEPAEADATRP